jgi:hypothetical protein
MRMNTITMRVLFIVASVYDGALGAAFLLFGAELFRVLNVTPPNHFGYVQFPALLLIIFAVMFFRISRDPAGNRELMLYGVALKASYAGTVFWHQMHDGLPAFWIPWAWADLFFLVLFLLAWRQTASDRRS